MRNTIKAEMYLFISPIGSNCFHGPIFSYCFKTQNKKLGNNHKLKKKLVLKGKTKKTKKVCNRKICCWALDKCKFRELNVK